MPFTSPTLTLAIITHNEEKNIHIPLDSAYDLADEVLIVDGESKDKTIEIAKSYGPKIRILQTDNPPNFLVNKQRAIDNSKSDWILQLDADERLSDKLKQEILNLKKNNFSVSDKNISGFNIPRKNWFLSRFLTKGGAYPDYVLRLYDRKKAHFTLENVHENAKISGNIHTTKEAIEHMADPTLSRYLTRWKRYNDFDAKELKKSGKTPCIFCYLIGKPIIAFISIYVRHKGFMDGLPGLIWAFFSAIRYWDIYFKSVQK